MNLLPHSCVCWYFTLEVFTVYSQPIGYYCLRHIRRRNRGNFHGLNVFVTFLLCCSMFLRTFSMYFSVYSGIFRQPATFLIKPKIKLQKKNASQCMSLMLFLRQSMHEPDVVYTPVNAWAWRCLLHHQSKTWKQLNQNNRRIEQKQNHGAASQLIDILEVLPLLTKLRLRPFRILHISNEGYVLGGWCKRKKTSNKTTI